MNAFAWLFTLAAIGLSISSYLVSERKMASAPVCPIGGHCKDVLTSKYNKTLGIHNDLLGMVFYGSMIVLTGLMVLEVHPVDSWVFFANVALLVASGMSLRFIYLQWRVLKAWCFWCLMSAATVGGMELIALLRAFDVIS